MYKDLKVTSGEVAANNVKSAPDRLQGTATENKNIFDKLVELFVAKYNSLLDELDDNEIKAIDPITINGYTISHANSGVTQGMYGTDQTQYPQHGETFIVPYFITDEHGHIVSAGNSEVQLPSGGGGGTSDYDDLTDKPSINSVTLSGNKSASDLSLASASHSHTKSDISDFPSLATVATTGDYDDLSDKPSIPTKVSDLTNDSGFISSETDPVFTASDAYGISSSDITAWNGKSTVSVTRHTTSGTNIADLTIDGTTTKLYAPTSGGTADYDSLSNRPQINSTTLTGNKTLTDLGMKTEILNLFYPVGSYYETSDTSFDPNNSWGGTWVLETEGQVHISGSTSGTYQVSGATTDTTDGGATTDSYTPSGSIGNTTLSDQQMAHHHDFTQPSVALGSHKHTAAASGTDRWFVESTVSGTANTTVSSNSSGNRRVYALSASSGSPFTTSATTHSTDLGTKNCTGGAVSDLSGANNTRTGHDHSWTGTSASIDIMQPYIVVNRWHRTA